jgi:Lipid A core - O-antigen ligase and related enzymes
MFEKILTAIKKIPYATFPIIFVIAVLPLIVYYYEFEAHLSMMSWYVSNDKTGDMFNYYKSEYLVTIAVIMIGVVIAGLVFSKKYHFHKAFIPLILYAMLVVLSTVFSDYRYFSLNGMDNHFETVYVLLSYCMLAAFCYWFTDSKGAVKFILYAWLIGIALIGVVGFFQVIGHDLYNTNFGKLLVIPEKLRKDMKITFNFPKGTVYLTLYNPNYVGFYAALTIPVLTALFVFVKNWFVKIAAFLLNVLIFLCLMGSGARNGMIAVFCSLLFMLVLFRKNLKTKWVYFLISYASMVAVFVIFNIVKGGMVTERLEAGFDVEKDTSDKLEKIDTNDENVTITYSGHDLVITMGLSQEEGVKIALADEDGDAIEMQRMNTENVSYKLLDDRFPFTITLGKVSGYYGFGVEIEEKTWLFSNQTEYQGYYFYSPYGKFTKIETAETAVFTNYSKLASGRGYLWARTIPLLKDYIFLGSGPDTFTVVFPQKDYVAASKMGYDKLTVTKPHNLYLQIGTQTGVVSLIAFLALNFIYLWECLRLYWKRRADDFLQYMGMAIMIAIIGYLISGIINDSTITVAPVYWCLIGIGFAINRLVKCKRKEELN